MSKKRILCYFVCLVLTSTSCTTSRIIFYNYSNVDDYTIFDFHTVQNQSPEYRFSKKISSEIFEQFELTINSQKKYFDDFLESTQTTSLIVIQDKSILFEKYFGEYHRSSTVSSFSISKSIISALIGIAIEERKIQGIEQPITHYFPELKLNSGFSQIKIKHLLQMTSGIQFSENYSWLGDAAQFYYTLNLKELIYQLKIEHPPGTEMKYKSVDTQLLGMILENATGVRVSEYLQEKIWKKLGMEAPATWSVDSQESGIEKSFCCLNGHAIDFAKFGQLFLQQGYWNGKMIVPSSWIKLSTQIDTTDGSKKWYQFQWWLVDPQKSMSYMAKGLHGQYIYISPESSIVIVRFGKEKGGVNWPLVFRIIDQLIVKQKQKESIKT